MNYVDGCVIPVPIAKRDAYLKHAAIAATVFKEHGALAVVDCWGDDVPEGKVTSFRWQCSARTTRPSYSPGSPGRRAPLETLA
jgi:uncharacterized protein YbaA (DUF1428 family)